MSEATARTELIVPEPAAALSGLLGVAPPDLESEVGLPLTWHWLYLLDRPRQEDLGADGHPTRHALPAPPGPGRRRMWAGGQLHQSAPLRVGEPATRTSRLLETTERTGAGGALTFVTVGHTITQRGQVVIEERQDIVYRAEAAAAVVGREARRSDTSAQSGSIAPSDDAQQQPAVWSLPVTTSLLFRFSALTYNAHRIHYDRDFARSEGYPGLVVHGPLQAMAMAEAVRAQGLAPVGAVSFDYRLVAPLIEGEGLVVGVTRHPGDVRTVVRDAAGRRTAQGRLHPD